MSQVIWEENSKGGTINVCEMLRVNLLLLRLLQDLILALVCISASEDPQVNFTFNPGMYISPGQIN